MQLDVHVHERLLHVLHVDGGIVHEPFAMTKVAAQRHEPVSRPGRAASTSPTPPTCLTLTAPKPSGRLRG
jgi:hypothetical protein